MNRTNAWIVGSVVVVACVILGVSGLFGQRFAPPSADRGDVGRYVVVRNTDDAVIIMDSTTGDLYRATTDDIRPFRDRPRSDKDSVKDVIRDTVKDATKDAFRDKLPPKDVIKDAIKDKNP